MDLIPVSRSLRPDITRLYEEFDPSQNGACKPSDSIWHKAPRHLLSSPNINKRKRML